MEDRGIRILKLFLKKIKDMLNQLVDLKYAQIVMNTVMYIWFIIIVFVFETFI